MSTVKGDLQALANPEKAAFFPRFFKAGPGGYAEGDRFLGVTVPQVRTVAKRHSTLPLPDIAKLLRDPWHEARLAALIILAERYRKTKDPAQREGLRVFYLEHVRGVNNWDLVDTSAPILMEAAPQALLDDLAASGDLWKQRIAIVATLSWIRRGDMRPTLRIAKALLHHKHDLIHKACGWMLREMGKRDEAALRGFLDQHAAVMPRTMLRYAIERLTSQDKLYYMTKKRADQK